ncbi:ATP-transf domain-containing protein [Mycena kentingensis (nom. inval.)]|nr:ATP-transf domain-containing protein [Mycena kentingensis (nom. inval.)]
MSLSLIFVLVARTTMSEILGKLPAQYEAAVAAGDLLFYPSTVTKHADKQSGVEYEIRLCPALQKKPTQSHTPIAAKPKVDPFLPPYNTLLVGELRDADSEEEYVVLLNKYSVVPMHFLLVTKEFRSQASPLTPPDLVQTYSLLAAARKARRPLFAFYNCGDVSGASQPHRHVQFLPLDLDEDGPPIEYLARRIKLETPDRPFTLPLSYANHVFRFPDRFYAFPRDQLEPILADAFLGLLDLAISTIRHDPEYPAGKPSYNVVLTLEHMHLVPRRKEAHILAETGDELSVNALAFAGMLLVKSEAELEAVKKEGVPDILRDVALQSVHDVQVLAELDE